jgi:hypothetical protein
MRQISLAALAILFLLSVAGVCSTDIYVAQNAAGANSGAGCSNAHSAAWFNAGSNWGAGNNRIAPGTTVHLCGNITTTLKFQSSGAAGNPITLLFDKGATMTTSVWSTAITMDGRSYVIVDGGLPCGPKGNACNGYISNTGNSTSGGHSPSVGISAQTCNHCEIRNIGIYNIYVHSGGSAEVDQTQVNCINFNGNNISIHDSNMHDAGWCLLESSQPANDANIDIYNNNIYNIDHGWALTLYGTSGLPGPNAGPFYFHNNHIHDYGNWDTSSNAYHHDGVHCYATPSGNTSGAHHVGTWIYNNLFDGNPGQNLTGHIFMEPGQQTDGSATPCADPTSLEYFFGNVFIIPSGRSDQNGIINLGAHSGSNPLQKVVFYNNTILGNDTSPNQGTIGLNFNNVVTGGTGVQFKNNIVGGANYLLGGVQSTATDYNGYVNCISYNCWNGTNNFANWKSSCACDSHSVSSISGMGGVSPTTGALQTGSPMIGAGTNLSLAIAAWPAAQRAALLTDQNQNLRGTGNWDIGALSNLAGSKPNPPTNLTAVPQ